MGRARVLRLVGALVAAVVLLGAGLLVGRASRAAPPDVTARGTLADVPDGPVEVIAETVRLAEGFRDRHVHGGPTFNRIVSGRVRLTEEDGRVAELGAGDFFFEPADRPHVIEVLADVRMDVVRLIPEGREATTGLD